MASTVECHCPLPLLLSQLLLLITSTSALNNPRASEPRNILFFTQFGSSSHVHSVTPAIEALSARGHNVTYLTFRAPTFVDSRTTDRVTVVLLEHVGHFLDGHQENVFNASYSNPREFFRVMRTITVDTCDVFLNDPGFRRIVVDHNDRRPWTYDVVVMDPTGSECGLSLVWLLGSPPLAFYSPTSLMSWIALHLDVPTPFAYVPMITRRFSDRMSFAQRLSNSLQNLLFWSLRNRLLAPILQRKIRKLHPSVPPILDIGRNASFVFANSYSPALDFPRPLAPFFKEVGGVHCRAARPLPKDIEEFIQGAGQHGFVYFSMGSYIRASEMPAKMLDAFLRTFRKIKQRVLWKCDANIADLPSNVRLINWAPQQDLLGHQNIRLFITQFGQLSMQESVFHGVPMVGMPFGADQFMNMKIAVNRGMGESLDYLNYDHDMVYNTVTKVLNDPTYKTNLRRYSALMRDRPMAGIDTVVYWVEYLARHRDARPDLRFQSSHLAFHQQMLLDVFGSTLLTIVVLAFATKMILWKLIVRCRPTEVRLRLASIFRKSPTVKLIVHCRNKEEIF